MKKKTHRTKKKCTTTFVCTAQKHSTNNMWMSVTTSKTFFFFSLYTCFVFLVYSPFLWLACHVQNIVLRLFFISFSRKKKNENKVLVYCTNWRSVLPSITATFSFCYKILSHLFWLSLFFISQTKIATLSSSNKSKFFLNAIFWYSASLCQLSFVSAVWR